MKQLTKRTASLLLVLAMLVTLFSSLTSVSAVSYPTYNNGKIGELCTSLSSFAKAYYTGNYTYERLSAQSGATLKSSISSLVNSDRDTVGYGGLRTYFAKSDAYEGSTSKLRLFYCGLGYNSEWSGDTNYNREHMWPDSLGGSAAEGDLHSMRPTDKKLNSTRGNLPYGETTNGKACYADANHNSLLGGYTGGGFFEPLDNVKGDVARAILYDYCTYSSLSNLNVVFQSPTVLLNWIALDPVDEFEMSRNDVVEGIEGCRNPFVDYPELAWPVFNQTAPKDMPTPSNPNATSYTITALSNNNAYGTVSQTGKTVTAAPKTGYTVDVSNPYTLAPATAATVSRSGNVFTLSNVTADCTLTVNFTAIVYSLTAKANNTAWGTVTTSGNIVTATPADGYMVDGYTLSPSNGATVTQNGNAFTVSNLTANCTLTVNFAVNPCEHPTTEVKTVDPTCTSAGATNTVCTVCGELVSSVPIDALGHNYQSVVTAPTCTAKGYTTYTCTRCDSSYTKNYTDMIAHNFADGVCTVCGKSDGSTPPPADYTDVVESKWYYDAVQYATKKGLMNGVGENQFAPDAEVTRAMLVTILYRAENKPSVAGKTNPFTDVANGKWYTDAIIWAADKGIVNGTSATTFAPEASITREQIAAILYRYEGTPDGKGDLSVFPDADTVSSYAVAPMQWAVGEGLIAGLDGKLAPKESATRAQLATILMRYLEQ